MPSTNNLAKRYGRHPSFGYWHISNELSGYCYCDLCMGAFQRWLEKKYGTLDALNEAYWSRFWNHAYTAWDQIRYIDGTIAGLVLDWKRFMTGQCCDFIRNEVEPIRRLSPEVPVTTNLMGTAPDLDYWKLAEELDIVFWDAYPEWHTPENPNFESNRHESNVPLNVAFRHDLTRSGCGLLFPAPQNRSSCEQFHGAVIDHVGHDNTRVFKEVASLGAKQYADAETGEAAAGSLSMPAYGSRVFIEA